ncbi:pyrroloquinoline quinone biosynthesis protein D [Pseudarthrobacter enclensis]|uniref:Pyrroloquinoline quinone biosynthesis protein PqqD n=1 Tax=Pseudarthrobacter enclensis TaxID=993070 RepID=A0A0V8IV74_9MICC|nr:PqqD family protein [Pseudarthrobacter enclensis]KSU78686.1 pyrroloquinoline quinone biosynthesis protein PqqD [Pseudarthrobacter enclensis]SCB75220.1 pyrroloquinoline quinone biosynthesis protein D [Pseudarthrobacter enclensis]
MIWNHCSDVAQVRAQHRGRVALLHLDEIQPVVLEGPAAAIWDLIDGQRTEQDILAELEAAFDDVLGEMQAQAELFLASLEARRLIEPAHSTL